MFKRIVLACIITTFLNANTCEPYKPIIDGCSEIKEIKGTGTFKR